MTELGGGPTRLRKATQSFTVAGRARPDVGVLVLHGFAGSPAEMRPLGLALNRAGFTVHIPLLPRHGDVPARLRGARYHEWIDGALDGLERLSGCQHLFLAGLSMGGLLALYLAALAAGADEGFEAARLAPLTRLGGIIVMAAPADARIDVADLAEVRRQGDAARIPLDAIDQLIGLNARVIDLLPRVTAPALFMQGRLDRTITADSAGRLRGGVGSSDAAIMWFERSGHVLTTDVEKDAVADCAVAFVRGLI